MIASGGNTVTTTLSPGICLVYGPSASLSDRGFVSFSGGNFVNLRSRLLSRIKAMEGSRALSMNGTDTNGHAGNSSMFLPNLCFSELGFFYFVFYFPFGFPFLCFVLCLWAVWLLRKWWEKS